MGCNGTSPLAEGRELKFVDALPLPPRPASPLAEGRELKFCAGRHDMPVGESPLAEGRELKFGHASFALTADRRPSRRGVN